MKNILFVASEAVPFIKTGGLADVAGTLPKCFDKKYFDVRVIIPKYMCIPEEVRFKFEYIDHFYMYYNGQERYVGILKYVQDGVTFYFIDNESYFSRPKPYGDWLYDLEKFAFFSQAALSALRSHRDTLNALKIRIEAQFGKNAAKAVQDATDMLEALSLSLNEALSAQSTAASGARIKYAQLQCLCGTADYAAGFAK